MDTIRVGKDELEELRSILEDLRAELCTEYGYPYEELQRFEQGMAILGRYLDRCACCGRLNGE